MNSSKDIITLSSESDDLVEQLADLHHERTFSEAERQTALFVFAVGEGLAHIRNEKIENEGGQ